MAAVVDRRNELAGNLSLHQELFFIEDERKMNELLAKGLLGDSERYQSKYRPIAIRRIEMSGPLDSASKLDRSPRFIRRLMGQGEDKAGEFLTAISFEDAWKAGDAYAVMAFFAEDTEVRSAPALPGHASYNGRSQVERLVREHLSGDLLVNSRKQQVAGERVTWAVEAISYGAGEPVEGSAEVVFQNGKIKSLTFEGRDRESAEYALTRVEECCPGACLG